jgi:(2Fe-2S) ferredoxin
MSEERKTDPGQAPFFRQHVFFCCNTRTDGREFCNERGAQELREYCKEQVKKKGLNGVGRARVNQAGCLDRCKQGPVLVIYPEGVWYRYDTRADIDEIIDEHLANGRVVERLRI